MDLFLHVLAETVLESVPDEWVPDTEEATERAVEIIHDWFPLKLLHLIFERAVEEWVEGGIGDEWPYYVGEAADIYRDMEGVGWPDWGDRAHLFRRWNEDMPRMPSRAKQATYRGA